MLIWNHSVRSQKVSARTGLRLLGLSGQEALHELGVELAGTEVFVAEDGLVKRDRSVDALHDELRKSAFGTDHGLLAIDAVADELGDERVVVGRDDAFGVLRRVDADAVATGHIEGCNLSRRWSEFARVLGVDAALDGVAADFELRRKNVTELFAGGDAELCFDEVDPGDGFGDRVLDLDARIHLNEVELAVLVHQELDRSGVLVADMGEAANESLADLLAHLRRDLKRRRFFDEFLMAALDGALALEECGDVAVLIGENLELDVARLLDELLHVEFAIAEGVGRFSGCGLEEVGELLPTAHNAHAPATTARLGFEDDGIADGLGDRERFAFVAQHAVGARKNRNLRVLHGLAGFFFFTHEAGDFGGRSDEFDVRGAADLGKIGVFAQQAVAGMDGIDVGNFGRGDDGGDIEIAVGSAWWADADGLVGKAHVQRVAIGFAVDGDGTNAEFATGIDDAQRNFAAVGDHDFTKHREVSSPGWKTTVGRIRSAGRW